MFSGAVRFIERCLLSRRRGPTWLLIIVIAVASGAVMATAAGGRRASTSFDRLIAWTQPSDASTGGMGLDTSEHADEVLTAASKLPVVTASTRAILLGDGVRTPDGHTYLGGVYPVALDVDYETFGRIKTLEGRFPRPDAVNEATVSFVTADLLGLHVGDTVDILFGDPAEPSSSFEPVVIVGTSAYPGDFPSLVGRPDRVVVLTPAFKAAHPERVDWTNGFLDVQLRGTGVEGVEEFRKEIAEAGLPVSDVTSLHEQGAGPRRVVAIEGRSLWLVAAILAAATLMVLIQLMRRDAWLLSDQLRELRNLGLSNRGLVATGALRGLRVGLFGAAIGVVVAVGLSPLFPIGLSRIADPHVGFHADLVVLTCGAVAAIGLAAATGAVSVRGAARRRGFGPRRATRGATLTSWLGPVGSTGAQLAFGSSTRSYDESTRPGLTNLMLTLALLVGSVSLGTSFDHLVETPALVGATWDMTLVFEDPVEHEQARTALINDPAVESIAAGGWSSVLVNDNEIYTMVLDTDQGVELAIDRGRAPSGSTEIALASAELAELDVAPGDEVTIQLPGDGSDPTTPLRATVTGRVILASPAYQPLALGRGAAIPLALFDRLGGPNGDVPSFMVKLRSGAPVVATYDDLVDRLHPNFSFLRPDNVGISALKDISDVARALVAILAALCTISFLHLLVVTTRRHRRMMATLRSLGMTRAQTRRAQMMHGALVASTTVVVAIPIAVLAARLTWLRVAEFLGAVADPVTSISQTILIVVITIAGGASVARLVGSRQQRTPPGELLHSE